MMNVEDKKGYTSRTWELLRAGELVRIVCFGDSITEGYAVRRGFPSFWRDMLQERYPSAQIEMHNRGISGNTTLDGLARVDWDVIPHRPDLVTINFGINDAAYGIGLEEFRDNLTEIVVRIQEACGSEILLLSSQPLLTPYFQRLVLTYYRAISEVAASTGTGFVDVCGAWMELVGEGRSLEEFILEGLDHPNEEGYRLIAQTLMRWV